MNKIVETKDFSPTIYNHQFQQTYHSIHGAIAESEHVFIKHGLEEKSKTKTTISIFEMGFGTGLNAALTWNYAENNQLTIDYQTIEKYPLELALSAEYKTQDKYINTKLNTLHSSEWNVDYKFPYFQFKKIQTGIEEYSYEENRFDVIYYDAFSPNSQPELWTEDIFLNMYNLLRDGGILTTYCAKGEVKRTLKKTGFKVLSPPGPLGKREMTMALK